MKHRFFALVSLCLVAASVIGADKQPASRRQAPTWAKKATAFAALCFPGDYGRCKRLSIQAPDGRSVVSVSYFKSGENLIADLEVVSPGQKPRTAYIAQETWGDVELLWSPDSKAFLVNGAAGDYFGGWVSVYRLDDPSLQPMNLAEALRREMVEEFPPCRAADLDQEECKRIEQSPDDYSVSGLDWVRGSSSLIAMVEVPCAGSYGGIECQVMGYKVEVPTGKILMRLDAKRLRSMWQQSMAFQFRVPAPPKFK